MYGSVFKDWIKEDEYSHWGYCDLDVVYGKISLFITQDMLEYVSNGGTSPNEAVQCEMNV